MRGKISNLVLLGMLVGVLLGGLLGYFLPSVMLATSFVGRLFLNAFRIIMVPLLITSLVVGVSSLGGTRRIGRMAAATILYYLAIGVVAALIGLVTVQLLAPGAGLNAPAAQIPSGIPRPEFSTLTDFLATLIPDNPVVAIVQGHLFGHVLLALFVGGILVTLGPRGRTAIHFFHELREALFRLVIMLLKIAPLGLLSLVGTIVAQNPESISGAGGSLTMYTITMVVAVLIYAGLILPLVLKLFGKQAPFAYLGNLMPALATGFATSSSAAALPVTYQCVVERSRIDSRAGNLVLPFGAMVNMGATSLYLVVATMFIAQAFNVDVSFGQTILIVAAAVLLSLTATGLPSAAFLTMAGMLAIADFPAPAYAGLGLILLVDWIVDRFRVKACVWGDAVGAAVVARFVESSGQRPNEFMSRDSSGQERPRRMDRPQGGRPERPGGDRDNFRRDRDRDRDRQGRPDDRGVRRDGGGPRRDRPNERRRDFDRRSPFAVADKSSAVIGGEHVEVEAMNVDLSDEITPSEETARNLDRPYGGDRDRERGDRDRSERGDRERGDRGDRGERGERDRADRSDRGDRSDRSDRGEHGDRDRGDRDRGGRGRRDHRSGRPRRDRRDFREPRENAAAPVGEEGQPVEQPDLPGLESQVNSEPAGSYTAASSETPAPETQEIWFRQEESEDTEITRGEGSSEDSDETEAASREVSYGRQRHRRFERPRSEGSGENDADAPGPTTTGTESPETPSHPEGPVEFGRARRKRMR